MAKRFYGMDVRGKFWPERLASEPVWTPDDEGRVFYDEAIESIKFGTSSDWSNAGAYNDVPLNTILLIESDTQLTGYSLLTNKDDDVVYVTKGSVAGGEVGGTDKLNGFAGHTVSWTQPGHDHTVASHTHPVSSHNHGGVSGSSSIPGAPAHTHGTQAGFTQFMGISGGSHGRAGDSYGVFPNTDTGGGGSSAHTHSVSSGTATATSGGGGNTGPDGTANSWRPKGRNFTRQQRT